MEINLNVTFGMAPSMTATIRALLAAPLREKECETESENKEGAPTEKPEPKREPKTKKVAAKPESATASKTEAAQEPGTPVSEPVSSAAPSNSEPVPASAPAPEYREKPEDVLPLLRERFAIPKSKEDRDDQQQALAKELNRAVISVIREVTKNTGAKSISDLRTDDDKREFIRMALLITYDVGTGKFKTMPF